MEAQNINRYYNKYYVDVKKVDGKLKIQLQHPGEILKTRVRLKLAAGDKVESVRFAQTDGVVISDNMAFEGYTDSPDVFIRVNRHGNYIATVRLTDGKEVRYAVEAKAPTKHKLYYEIKISEMNGSK